MFRIASTAPARNITLAGYKPLREEPLDRILQRTIKVQEGSLAGTATETSINPDPWYEKVKEIWETQVQEPAKKGSKPVWLASYDATDDMFKDSHKLKQALRTLYEKPKLPGGSDDNRPRNSRIIARVAKKYGIDTDSKEWQHFATNWLAQFEIKPTKFEIRWDWDAFNFLGNIPGIDEAKSCYSTTYQGRNGAWADAPVTLYTGLGNQVPTFVIFLIDPNSEEDKPIYLGRCWGFLDAPSRDKDERYDFMWLSNGYCHDTLKAWDINIFVQVLETATGNKYKYNKVRPDGKETKITGLNIPVWVNADPVYGYSQDVPGAYLGKRAPEPLVRIPVCVHCKAAPNHTETYLHMFCNDCRSGYVPVINVCSECATTFRVPPRHMNGRVLCPGCYELFKMCASCSTMFKLNRNNIISYNNSVFCSDDCYKKVVRTCNICKTAHTQGIESTLFGEVQHFCTPKHYMMAYFKHLEKKRLLNLIQTIKTQPLQVPIPTGNTTTVYSKTGVLISLDPSSNRCTVGNDIEVDITDQGFIDLLSHGVYNSPLGIQNNQTIDTTILGLIKQLIERHANASNS